jgi:hypothetical protein
MDTQPIKCASRDFTKSPFYLIQINNSEKRYVVSFQDIEKIRSFILHFAGKAKGDLQIKIRDFSDRGNPVDYTGTVTLEKLKEVLEAYEELLFHNGYHDLMLRLPESGEYIAFDEHGLMFIYTRGEYKPLLESMNIPFKPEEKLIYEFDHWHYSPANGKEDLRKLITELNLLALDLEPGD